MKRAPLTRSPSFPQHAPLLLTRNIKREQSERRSAIKQVQISWSRRQLEKIRSSHLSGTLLCSSPQPDKCSCCYCCLCSSRGEKYSLGAAQKTTVPLTGQKDEASTRKRPAWTSERSPWSYLMQLLQESTTNQNKSHCHITCILLPFPVHCIFLFCFLENLCCY